jgi:hypothetical protein
VNDVDDSRDRGLVSGFVVCLALTLTAMAGLAVDSGRLVAARLEATDHAENAARLGAQEVDQIRLGVRTVDPMRAREVTSAYFSDHGLDGSMTVNDQTVTVTIYDEQETTILHLFGVGTRQFTVTRRATIVAG